MKKNSLSLVFLMFLTTFISLNAQEDLVFSYNYALNWLSIEPQNIKEPILNIGADVAGNTFKSTDFFKIIPTPDFQRPGKDRKVFENPKSPIWKESITSKSGYFTWQRMERSFRLKVFEHPKRHWRELPR